MTQTADIEAFSAGLPGTALVRGDDGYHEARSAWNGEANRYPAVIARCRSAADVAAAIEFARQRGPGSRCAVASTTPRAPQSATAA